MQAPDINFSVLIGRVSTEDGDVVIETLAALQPQIAGRALEVIVVDRVNDAVTRRIASEFPWVRIELANASDSLPALRYRALQMARGQHVIVTEDHCVPTSTWLTDFAHAVGKYANAGAIAGSVSNGVTSSAWHWATYLCEYAACAPPLPAGPAATIAGMNTAYPRSLLMSLPPGLLQDKFWESRAHQAIAAQGHPLVQVSGIRIAHCKKFSVRHFMQQRYLYSRQFAGTRFAPRQLARRCLAAAACLLLPPLLVARLVNCLRSRRQLRTAAVRAMPWLLVMYVVWAAGEAVGYLKGPGDALRRIE